MTAPRTARPLYDVPPLDAALQAAVAAKPGICRYCGCSETTACRVQTLSGEERCYWIDKLNTICSATPCQNKYVELARALMRELASNFCCCGRRKKRRETFCMSHYWLLPDVMRGALYRQFGEGYEDAYARARYFLLHGEKP